MPSNYKFAEIASGISAGIPLGSHVARTAIPLETPTEISLIFLLGLLPIFLLAGNFFGFQSLKRSEL